MRPTISAGFGIALLHRAIAYTCCALCDAGIKPGDVFAGTPDAPLCGVCQPVGTSRYLPTHPHNRRVSKAARSWKGQDHARGQDSRR